MEKLHPPRIEIEAEVHFFDTDCGGVVSNIAYLRFIEEARTKLTSSLGLCPAEMMETQLFPAVARTEIDYLRPARLGDRLLVSAELETLEAVRFRCGFSIRRPVDDQLLVECRQTLALIQLPGGRPRRVPGEWRREYPDLTGKKGAPS